VTPHLITAASLISTRLYGLFDLGSYIARLVEAGVQKCGEPLDPYWLYAVLSSGYKHFAYFSGQVLEVGGGAPLYILIPTLAHFSLLPLADAPCLDPSAAG